MSQWKAFHKPAAFHVHLFVRAQYRDKSEFSVIVYCLTGWRAWLYQLLYYYQTSFISLTLSFSLHSSLRRQHFERCNYLLKLTRFIATSRWMCMWMTVSPCVWAVSVGCTSRWICYALDFFFLSTKIRCVSLVHTWREENTWFLTNSKILLKKERELAHCVVYSTLVSTFLSVNHLIAPDWIYAVQEESR